MPIDVSAALSEVIAAESRVSAKLLKAAGSPDREAYRRTLKAWQAVQRRRRELWLAMASK